jgi:hypothetical protein
MKPAIYLAQGITGEQLMAKKGLKEVVINGRRHIIREPELYYIVMQSKMNDEICKNKKLLK